MLHEHKKYENPYPIDKRIEPIMCERPGLNKQFKLTPANLVFDSDFESGNLDIAVKINES